jgi:hypothetical protein
MPVVLHIFHGPGANSYSDRFNRAKKYFFSREVPGKKCDHHANARDRDENQGLSMDRKKKFRVEF